MSAKPSASVSPAGWRTLQGLVEAMAHAPDPRGVTSDRVIAALRGRPSLALMAAVPRLLAEFARDTRERGVPIEVTTDTPGTL